MDNNGKPKTELDLDDLLSKLGLGRYQLTIIILAGILIAFSSISPISFTLAAGDLNYRCKIKECDEEPPTYEQPWIINAIPYKQYGLNKCRRYKSSNITGNWTMCPAIMFDQTSTVRCNEWVFETQERTILNDFDIMCDENRWKLTSVGTLNNIAQFLGIPISGVLSDKFGRKSMMVFITFASIVFGISRAFSTSIIMFATFEFLDSFFSSGIYPIVFILSQEIMTPTHRPLAGMIVCSAYPLGAMIFGCLSFYFMDWRKSILACYVPSLLFVSYWWAIPESIRWLQMKGNYNQTLEILKIISVQNKQPLPENTLQYIKRSEYSTEKVGGMWEAIKTCIQSRVILFRLLLCSLCWFANTMVYFGLSFNAVELAGNKFANFIAVNAVDIPACILSGLILKKIKRRPSQSAAYLFTGIGCILCEFIPSDVPSIKLVIYMLSKFSIAISYTIMSVFSGEIFPTELRLSLFSLSSTFGRIGSMIAPQTPLLKDYLGVHAPVFLFGGISLIGGFLSLMFPETYQKKLDDRVNETEKTMTS